MHVVELVMLVILVDERLLLALVLELLVRLLALSQGASKSNCGSARLIVVVAKINLHGRLLRCLRLVCVWRHSQNVDLLVEAALIKVIVEASVPAFAALVGLLRVVT